MPSRRIRPLVRRELEGGLQERVKVNLPAVLAIQSGINEPRYVSIMGIRKASKVERKVFKAQEYQDGLAGKIDVEKWIYPPTKGGATMLTGDMDSICKELLGILKEKGVLSMSYGLIVGEVRRGQFEERNLDAVGLCNVLGKESVLLIPEGDYGVQENSVNAIVRIGVEESLFLNPLNMVNILQRVFDTRGKPSVIHLHVLILRQRACCLHGRMFRPASHH